MKDEYIFLNTALREGFLGLCPVSGVTVKLESEPKLTNNFFVGVLWYLILWGLGLPLENERGLLKQLLISLAAWGKGGLCTQL